MADVGIQFAVAGGHGVYLRSLSGEYALSWLLSPLGPGSGIHLWIVLLCSIVCGGEGVSRTDDAAPDGGFSEV